VRSVLVITNSDAGTADAENLDAALSVLRTEVDVEVVATGSPDELDDVLDRAAVRRVVVAGGDGSLHAVVQALHRRHELADVVLGLIPLGTGNDFARGTGIPIDPAEAARVVLDATPRPVDLIVDDSGAVVVNNVHVGIGAQAGRRAERWKVRFGRIGYPIGALLAAVSPEDLRLRVEVDGELLVDRQRVLQVALGNGSHVGGGTELNPEADPTDGGIDVVISRAVGRWARLAYAVRLRRGEHHRLDDVLHLEAREVRISGDEFWCSADGEIDGPMSRRSWRLLPSAYRMTLP